MEKAIVIFKNPDTEKAITITLEYNKTDSSVDYSLDLGDYAENLKDNVDFVGFLASMFLTSLEN